MHILLVIIIVGIVGSLLIAMNSDRLLGRTCDVPDYKSRGPLFTPAERSFLGVLEQALDSRYRVFGKVRLGDLVRPSRGLAARKRAAAQNGINQKHVDFVICTSNELALVGVIELDDSSHERESRARRDAFVDQVLAKAGIPLLRLPAEKGYSLAELRARLAKMMLAGTRGGGVPTGATANPSLAAIMESTPAQPDPSAPACPSCMAVMVKRLTLKGGKAGSYFWACSAFPVCRQVVDIQKG